MNNILGKAQQPATVLGLCLLISITACQSVDAIDGVTESPTTAVQIVAHPSTDPVTQLTVMVAPDAVGKTPTSGAAATLPPPPTPTSVQTSTPTDQAVIATGALTVTPTATPPPTFTPPPPPPAIAGEHFLFQRPVPASGPAWTDKAYPYGSTRGGLLRPHTGVEFVVPEGTPVLATGSGTVIVAGDDNLTAYGPQTNFYGNLVIIELDNSGRESSTFALYGHMSEIDVTVGQRIAAGDALGLSGATGVADGPHLHFEVRVGRNDYGATRNPLLWLVPLPQTGIVAGRVVGTGGELLYEAPISLVRADAPAPYTATTSYAQGEPNGDDAFRENFVLDDVIPGFYEVVVDTGNKNYSADLWVYPYRVNWIELVVGP